MFGDESNAHVLSVRDLCMRLRWVCGSWINQEGIILHTVGVISYGNIDSVLCRSEFCGTSTPVQSVLTTVRMTRPCSPIGSSLMNFK
jgi:hypothetical protein